MMYNENVVQETIRYLNGVSMKVIYHIKNTWKKIADAKKMNSKKVDQSKILDQISKIDDFLCQQMINVYDEPSYDAEDRHNIIADIEGIQKELRIIEDYIRQGKEGAYIKLREFIAITRTECCQKYYMQIMTWSSHLETLFKYYKAITLQQKAIFAEKINYKYCN